MEYTAKAKPVTQYQSDWASVHMLKTKLKAEGLTSKQQLKADTALAWKIIRKEKNSICYLQSPHKNLNSVKNNMVFMFMLISSITS